MRHLCFACLVAILQHKAGRYFIFEHPRRAASWEEATLQKLLNLSGVDVFSSDQCHFDLKSPDGVSWLTKATTFVANFPEAFVERLKRLEERAEARERYWKGVVREVQRVASEDSAELRKRCQAAVDGKNEQIRHFRERLNAIVATVHEQSLRRSVESGVGALEALAV